jgi:hypothetical protein
MAYYHCTISDIRTLTTHAILGTVLKQLLLPKTSLLHALRSQIESAFLSDHHVPEKEELARLLWLVSKAFSQVYIIIDGLDECEKVVQQDILFAMDRVILLHPQTKVWVASREDSEIKKGLEKHPYIKISEAHIAVDIVNFVQAAVAAKLCSGDLQIRDADLEDEIVSTLVTKSHGM